MGSLFKKIGLFLQAIRLHQIYPGISMITEFLLTTVPLAIVINTDKSQYFFFFCQSGENSLSLTTYVQLFYFHTAV